MLFMSDKEGRCYNLAHLMDGELRIGWEQTHKHRACEALSALIGTMRKKITSESKTIGLAMSEYRRHLLGQQGKSINYQTGLSI